MNYKKIYIDLILKAQSEHRKKSANIYYERHHFIPKCMGGDNDEENLVLLTAKEHFVAHKLLVEIYPENKKLFYALTSMAFLKKERRDYRISAGEYQRVKLQLARVASDRMKSNLNHRKGKKQSEITKKKIADAQRGEKSFWFNKKQSPATKLKRKNSKGYEKIIGIKRSAVTRKKQSELKKGENHFMWQKHHSQETKDKMSASAKGKIISIEQRLKISVSAKNKPFITCIHCGLMSRSKGTITRWHNENCKQNPNRKS